MRDPVPTLHVSGADLQGEGSYVVAAPSSFGKRAYEVVTSSFAGARRSAGGASVDLLRMVQPFQIAALVAWLKNAAPGVNHVRVEDRSPIEVIDPFAFGQAEAAVMEYRLRVERHGSRNLSLFESATLLRDRGWSASAVEAALAHAHAVQPAVREHEEEGYQARVSEAKRTVASAFSKPRRARVVRFPVESVAAQESVCDNALREAMLQHDKVNGTAFWRVYETLMLAHVKAGEWLSFKQIQGLVAPFGVGRPAVERMVDAVAPTSERLVWSEVPSPKPPTLCVVGIGQGFQQFQ